MLEIIELALSEDKIREDVTTNSLLDFDRPVNAEVIAKEPGVISGIDVFQKTFKIVDPKIRFKVHKPSGTAVKTGDIVI